ncbi:hypothetical protein EHS13_25930 [Paenibacillus psychroresistens]|uniref:Cysteine-rich CWC family protein n=1 Tax=Paenibacillus psychroresistens TaxID=1778678 RepID=A0A6B8RP10_9BACL|nr:cysteine-rich CWC family protein [Paenibacillus psychroresistens]QGQ98080.1 hypothetical protein EHS13_25930 [Paenibacillus psychroresistens]
MNCPICNKDSQCGVEAGQTIEACWCSKAVFPQEIFDQIPLDLKGKACICKACLDKFKQQ